MDLEKIEKLIKIVNNSGLSEFRLEEEGIKIKLVNQTQRVEVIAPISAPIAPETPQPQTPLSEDFFYISSPLVGVFKPLSTNDKTPIKVGDIITVGQPVCIIEAMKLINEIESDKSGEVVEILVNEGDSVEYGQEIFKLK